MVKNFDDNFIQYDQNKVKEETKNLALYFILHISLYIVLIFFAIFFCWYTVFITTHKYYAVYGPSMMPTLNAGITNIQNSSKQSLDAVYVDCVTGLKDYDIVVVERPNSDSVIKRLMASEGDFITIAKGTTQDGEDCFYFYRIKSGTDLTNFADSDALIKEENDENGYHIRGYQDWWANREVSLEITVVLSGTEYKSTYEENFYNTFSLYECDNLTESGVFVGEKFTYFVSQSGLVYVQVPEGKVFCMGDNRAHSTDSRENGFFLKSNIVGRAEFIIYNHNFGNRLLEVVKFYFREIETFFAR